MTATGRCLVDTNVFVYASDPTDAVKQSRALSLIEDLSRRGGLAISVQVLNEFYAAVIRPHKPPSLSREAAERSIRDMISAAVVLPLTAAITLRAIDAVRDHGLSFWDALIWAVAREHAIPVVYTEDFGHGREVEGVRFLNPFLGGA